MQLELKHLAAYLPYKLKILNGWGDIKILNYSYLDDYNNGFIVGIKPILRPLSDLTKDIEHNGEMFVPVEKLKKMGFFFGDKIYEKDATPDKVNNYCYEAVQILLSWHFDIFNLRENNLCIYYNEL